MPCHQPLQENHRRSRMRAVKRAATATPCGRGVILMNRLMIGNASAVKYTATISCSPPYPNAVSVNPTHHGIGSFQERSVYPRTACASGLAQRDRGDIHQACQCRTHGGTRRRSCPKHEECPPRRERKRPLGWKQVHGLAAGTRRSLP
jgi:hypothetical protein